MFDCRILQYIKNICCRFNLETMTFIFDFNIFIPPQHLLFIAIASGQEEKVAFEVRQQLRA